MSFESLANLPTSTTQMYEKNISDWMADRSTSNEKVLKQHLDLSQKKKFKKHFFTQSREQNMVNCNLSSMSSQLTQGPIHTCKDCSRSFKDINNYKEHRFQEHKITDYPNIRQCKLCSYATLLKSKYDCHMRCHLNNKVIKCQRCNYSTINIRHMSKHERLHMINIKNKNKSLIEFNENNTKVNLEIANKRDQNDDSMIKRKNEEITSQSNRFKMENQSHNNNAMYDLELIASNKKSRNNHHLLNSDILTNSLDELKKSENEQSFNFLNPNDNNIRKQSLSDETCSTHSSSSIVTPPWSSSSISTSSQSPPLHEQKILTSTSNSNTTPKTFHNVLSLISNCSKEQENSEFFEQHNMLHQPQANYENSIRSNFENLIKYQLSSNISASNFYTNLVNHHYQQTQLGHLNNNPNSKHNLSGDAAVPPISSHDALNNNNTSLQGLQQSQNNFFNAQQFQEFSQNCNCNHRTELINLRENILRLLYGIMPQFVSMSGIDNFENCNDDNKNLIQIDRMVDTLVQQINAT